ncbi:NAD(P)-dependent oxidoreductase [Aspergillus saccharolyticus JOP 1030-1]|uniref:NAD(P)-binding protein n=1 Tax=Aspergillus saccharolyticus JOP 1030-1 TaxID=1450539 RepID=A0A319A4N1_9EURO|nr:NAD(P)-binding protein [Aspergillus saccharolyticus JOP 1030-1]PYH42392.1 NAD(P)-binding protein [Aspergillus saccharolyticus JOP 1030-1]
MHVLIIGGSGRCGRLVIDELLRRGHTVTALVRDPEAMGAPRPNLHFIKGTPTHLPDIRTAFRAAAAAATSLALAAVIVTLSAPRTSDSPFSAPLGPPLLMADCNANIVQAMQEFGVRKTVILQACGVGASWKNMPWLLRLLMGKTNMAYQYADHNEVERRVRGSGVGFVFVRPMRLTEGDDVDTEKVKIWENDGQGVPLMGSISRRSVARFLVDVAEGDEWVGAAPVITSR